jgi:predicted amidohydrolase
MNIDLVLSRGSAIDGTETLNYRADAVIQDLSLREIGCISAPPDVATIDPAGVVVTARFIDIRDRLSHPLSSVARGEPRTRSNRETQCA